MISIAFPCGHLPIVQMTLFATGPKWTSILYLYPMYVM